MARWIFLNFGTTVTIITNTIKLTAIIDITFTQVRVPTLYPREMSTILIIARIAVNGAFKPRVKRVVKTC